MHACTRNDWEPALVPGGSRGRGAILAFRVRLDGKYGYVDRAGKCSASPRVAWGRGRKGIEDEDEHEHEKTSEPQNRYQGTCSLGRKRLTSLSGGGNIRRGLMVELRRLVRSMMCFPTAAELGLRTLGLRRRGWGGSG